MKGEDINLKGQKMPHIELQAGTSTEFTIPSMQIQTLQCDGENHPDLDDALARLLRIVRATGSEKDMDALGAMLAYMETLERKVSKAKPKSIEAVVLTPITLTI